MQRGDEEWRKEVIAAGDEWGERRMSTGWGGSRRRKGAGSE